MDEKYSFKHLENAIKGKSKDEKIKIIKEQINVFNEWKFNKDRDYTSEIFEYPFIEMTEALLKEVEGDNFFKTNYDLNWFFNPNNIPNQTLVFDTVNYIESEHKGLFDTLEFLNILQWHYQELSGSIDKPFTYLENYKNLPLSEKQKHVLLCLILKWFGGIPYSESGYDKTFTLRKILEREFLMQFDGHETSEKKYVLRGISYSMFPVEHRYWDIENNMMATDIEAQLQQGKFDFNALVKVSEKLRETKGKLAFWVGKRAEFLQAQSAWRDEQFKESPFLKRCDSEIEKLEKLLQLESVPTERIVSVEPSFELSKKTGARADLIRILNALYELGLITLKSGEKPTKEQFMKQVGGFFGVDLSKYDADLSQSLNNVSLEANLKVFDKMKEIITKAHYIGQKS